MQDVEPPSEEVEVDVDVKDGGMKLVRILTPDFSWEAGNADIDLRLRGRPGNVALQASFLPVVQPCNVKHKGCTYRYSKVNLESLIGSSIVSRPHCGRKLA